MLSSPKKVVVILVVAVMTVACVLAWRGNGESSSPAVQVNGEVLADAGLAYYNALNTYVKLYGSEDCANLRTPESEDDFLTLVKMFRHLQEVELAYMEGYQDKANTLFHTLSLGSFSERAAGIKKSLPASVGGKFAVAIPNLPESDTPLLSSNPNQSKQELCDKLLGLIKSISKRAAKEDPAILLHTAASLMRLLEMDDKTPREEFVNLNNTVDYLQSMLDTYYTK